MKPIRLVLVLAVLLAGAALAAGAEEARRVVVPVMGEFLDTGLGGRIQYDGEVTLLWTPTVERGATVWNLASWLVAQAWCLNTGAGYTLLGSCTGCLPGVEADKIVLSEPVTAFGRGARPVLATRVTVALSLPGGDQPPVVDGLAFASR